MYTEATEQTGAERLFSRRRSADVGGLHLATGNSGQGQGWVGDSGHLHTKFAELLSDMYTQTLNAVSDCNSESIHTDLPGNARSRLIPFLQSWNFNPHTLPEEEMMECTLILFEALFRIEGMQEAVNVSMAQISSFVRHLRQIYRLENSYHNFEHALDVLQATQCYLRSAGMVPPLTILKHTDQKWSNGKLFDSDKLITCLGLKDLFVLYIAAIGHDAGHPGLSNVFMKNANTPLSLVYEGQSALEQMHCQLLLRVMSQHGMDQLIHDPEDPQIRKLLWFSVMATDMSVHDDFMGRLRLAIAKEHLPISMRKIVICQGILKCADISNPSRPFPVSEYWAGALTEEWSMQASFEESLQLAQTVQSNSTQAKSQVFFIEKFAKPLLDLMVQAIPEMSLFAEQCSSNLSRWSELVHRPRVVRTQLPLPSSDYSSAFPLSLPLRIEERSPGDSASSESNPTSPSDSVVSSMFSPLTDVSGTGRTLPEHHAAIRAAGKLGMRQPRPKRNSWNPISNTGSQSSTIISSSAVPSVFRLDHEAPPASAPVLGTTALANRRKQVPLIVTPMDGDETIMGSKVQPA